MTLELKLAVCGLAALSGMLALAVHAGAGLSAAHWVAAALLGAAWIAAVWGICRSGIHQPLVALRDTLRLTRDDGDLSRRANCAHPLTGPTSEAYNELMQTLQSIIGKVCFTAAEVTQCAERLNGAALAANSGGSAQRRAAETTSGAIQDMMQRIRDIAAHASEASQQAGESLELSVGASDVSERAAEEIERIARMAETSAEAISRLGEQSRAIGGIVQVIREIADQTDLLALNAAIEAARAGEQGRGFAVVADEVRKLAERTASATFDISRVIESIQTDTDTAVATVQAGARQARTGTELAHKASGSLARIQSDTRNTLTRVEAIAASLDNQLRSGALVVRQAQDILQLVASNSAETDHTLHEASHLDALASNFREIGTVFKLGDTGSRALDLHGTMPAVVTQAAADIGTLLEQMLDSGRITEEALFDTHYQPIAGTRPQKFHSRFDTLTDEIFPPVQEPLLERHAHAVYAGAVDRNGYFPTHNKRYSQPLTGDEKIDMVNNRTKRLFDDPVGKRCASHSLPYLIQTYRRDTGEIMHDISAPIRVRGRHWGGFRIGYRA